MSTQFHNFVATVLMSRWIGCVGIFVPFFVAACYVQWEKLSNRRGINHVMAFATAFFGLTVTTVSDERPPQELTRELTQWCALPCRILPSHSLRPYDRSCTPREPRST